MTKEEMDRAIAEYVGDDRWLIVKRGYFYRPNGHGYTSCVSEAWVLPLAEAKRHEYLIGEEPVTLRKAPIPAYSTDLNAMHEAEASLTTHNELHAYRMTLGMDVSAPANKRAEAFLRTIGKYSDATHPLP